MHLATPGLAGQAVANPDVYMRRKAKNPAALEAPLNKPPDVADPHRHPDPTDTTDTYGSDVA
ncbi:hypothetical protein GCM10009804_14890 [Kribbella hippodromi]|uniref:Uncharacterized protein n=1 Tax=Kribbella hippodromi TaxID=434347 RepID=A0ABP4NEL2_9ACTN